MEQKEIIKTLVDLRHNSDDLTIREIARHALKLIDVQHQQITKLNRIAKQMNSDFAGLLRATRQATD